MNTRTRLAMRTLPHAFLTSRDGLTRQEWNLGVHAKLQKGVPTWHGLANDNQRFHRLARGKNFKKS
jgi:hypothetical protein